MKHDLPVFTLLIDADNVGKETIAPIIEEVTREARIAIRRIYGDFTTPQLASWRETLANHGIHPIQQYRNSVGKNASDSALIIDAMDLLHSGRFQGFCLVSSDSDFTRLATRIREDGLTVFGFGKKSTPKAFVNACERYIYVENLLTPLEMVSETVEISPEKENPAPKLTTCGETSPQAKALRLSASAEAAKQPIAKSASPAEAERLLKLLLKAYTNIAEEDGWALVSRIDQYLRANHSDFDPRNYGASTFPKLLGTLENFEVVQRKQGNGHAQFCRRKRQTTTPSHANQNTRNPAATPPAAYIEALKTAVAVCQSVDGWSGIADIRGYLHNHGHRLEDSGHDRLDEALKASGIFDMRDAGGMTKEFRLNPAIN